MNVLILGGENPRHYDWVRQVASTLQLHFDKVVYLDYRHWSEGGTIDIEYEIAQTAELAQNLGEYIIVAKSIGTIISILAIARGALRPVRCIFLGLPLGAAKRIPKTILALSKLPSTIIVQNDYDPVGSADDVKAYITASLNRQLSFQEVPGDTHDYLDFDQIAELAAKLN